MAQGAPSSRPSGWAWLVLTWIACGAFLTLKVLRLPSQAAVITDTPSYEQFAPYRPPLYGWVLAAYRAIAGDYAGLPLFQFGLIVAGALLFSLELARLLRRPWLAALAVPLVLSHAGVHDAARWIMSEAVYLALILVGLGLQFRHARLGGVASLAGAAICFALATATRSIGAVFLALPLLAASFDPRLRPAAALRQAGAVVLAAGLVLVLAMGANQWRNHRFEIGSWSGMSLLGKALLLLEPSDLPGLPQAAAETAPVAAELRRQIAAQPDLAARMRAQIQSFEDLRFAVFMPAAERSWPEWAASDARQRGELAGTLAKRLVARHLAGYFHLALRDFGALVLYPNFWPAWATAEPPDKNVFPACDLDPEGGCTMMGRYDLPAYDLGAMFLASAAGTLGGLLLALGALPAVLRRLAAPETVTFWAAAIVFLLSLVATAAYEAGLPRYMVALHATGVGLLFWFLARGLPARR